MTVVEATPADLDRIVDLLAERRRPLVPLAPIFWRPATDARAVHRRYLEHLLTTDAAVALLTADSVLIAARRGDGWVVDDAHVRDHRWLDGDGRALWDALADRAEGAPVSMVCPTYEQHRGDFARAAGLQVRHTWWLAELAGSEGGEPGVEVTLPGGEAVTVGAPPVYAPPGPMFLVHTATDLAAALPAARDEALRLGCAGIIVDREAGEPGDELLREAGLRRHCDYLAGTVARLT